MNLGNIWAPFSFDWVSKGGLGPKMEPESLEVRKMRIPGALTAPLPPSLFDDFSSHVPEIFDLFGILFACPISERFSMDSWTRGRVKIMQNHGRVSRNQGLAHSEKVRFQVQF